MNISSKKKRECRSRFVETWNESFLISTKLDSESRQLTEEESARFKPLIADMKEFTLEVQFARI